ncbi:MAG: YHS domain-containing protein [Gemmataceae bacterium]
MRRFIALVFLMVWIGVVVPAAAADKDDKSDAKEALKELQEFVGGWKGNGGPDKPRPGPRDPVWSESIHWIWRFKGDDAWLAMNVKDGKLFKSGELRFLPDKKRYQLTATDKSDKKLVYEGKIDREVLKLERVNPDTKATEQITMNTAAEGDRFIYHVAHKNEGTTIWRKDYLVACTREGVSLGKVDKKNECVVSGGLGTIAVSYKGETYYVCCSGCAEAFKENPEKYINEYKAKKAGKKK